MEEKKRQQEQQQQLLAEKKKKQEEEQRLLAEKQRKQEEEQRLLAEKKKKQEEEQRLLAEKKKQQEEKERLLAEKKKKQEEKERFLAEKKKQQEEQQRLLAEKKKKQEEQQRLLAEKKKQQEEEQRLLAEKKKQQEEQQRQLAEKQKQQEEQQRLLAEKKKQQEEQERLLAEQKKKLEEEKSKPILAEVVPLPEKKEQPKPIGGDVPEQAIPKQDMAQTASFDFYGTPMNVRWGKAPKFKLKGNDEKAFAAALRELTGADYNALLADCIKLRKEKNLCDWAYFKMLQNLAETACGKGTNEAVFLQGVLYCQSGYQMRFAYDGNHKLHLLARIDGFAYERHVIDDIEQLMACRFIVPYQGAVVDISKFGCIHTGDVHGISQAVVAVLRHLTLVEYDRVVEVASLDESSCKQGLDVAHEYKGAARSYLCGELLHME